MIKKIIICFCLVTTVLTGFAQTKAVKITPLSDEVYIIPETEYLIDSLGGLSVKEAMLNTHFRKLSGTMINFGSNPSYLWLRFTVSNQSDSSRNFVLVTKGIDSLWTYQLDTTARIIKSGFTGGHIPIQKREVTSPYLTFSFNLLPYQQSTLYIRVKNVSYPLSVYPFRVFSKYASMSFLKRSDLIQSLYIGIMLFLLLFSFALLIFFKEWIYFYYLLCVLFSMTMMLVYNDYYYLIFDQSPEFIRNKNFFGIPTTVVPMFYLFFAKEFLVYGYDKDGILRRLTIGMASLTVVVILLFVVFKLSFFTYRYYIYILIFLLCFLTFVLVYRSIKRHYRPAWIFLFATVPVLCIGVLETFSDLHHIPVQLMHTIYYGSTVFEMFVLTLGLALRFKIAQDEKKKLQGEVFAIETQVQETERKRIAQDLHDKLGGLLGALKVNLSMLSSNKQLKSQEAESLEKILQMLDLTSEEVRNISHSLASSTLTKLGLVPMLLEMYRDADNPKVIIQNNNFIGRLNQTKEMALYAIIQEGINNALKHAEPNEIAVIFKQSEDKLTVMIEDDGKGFEVQNSPSEGKGLENISFRVKEHLHGDLLIESSKNRGAIITIKFKI